MKYVVTLRDKTYEVEVEEGEALIVDEYEAYCPPEKPSSAPASTAQAQPATTTEPKAAAASSLANGQTPIEAPLPGNILRVDIKVGDSVAQGDVVFIIEAMKMENEVVSPSAGVIASIDVSVGQMVDTGDVLASLAID